jgi:hypothetical protein
MNLARERPILCGLLAATCWISISAAYGQSGRRLEGRILDQTGGWIPGARVTLYSDDRVRTTKADWDGNFAFADLTAPVHFLEASSTGFLFSSAPVANQTTGPVTLVLSPGQCGQCPSCYLFTYPPASYEERSSKVQLTGKVVDFSASPLPNASLNLMKVDLSTTEPISPDSHRNPSTNERSFRL